MERCLLAYAAVYRGAAESRRSDAADDPEAAESSYRGRLPEAHAFRILNSEF